MRVLLGLATVLLLWLGKLIPRYSETPTGANAALAGHVALLIIWLGALTRIPGSAIASHFGSWHNRWIGLGLGSALALFVASGVGYAVSGGVLKLTPPPEAGLRADTFGTRWLLLVAMSLAAAVLEEWLFRGVVLDGAADAPAWIVTIVSAAAFAVYHLSLFQLLPTFLLGAGLAVLVLYLDSLWPAVIAHAAFNMMGLVLFSVGSNGR